MPYKEGQPTLIGFLGMVPVQKVMKKPLFGAPYIRSFNYFEVLSFMYTSGAILGRARRSKLSILAKMLSVPGGEEKVMNWLQEQAKKRLDKFRNELGKEPQSFIEFIQFREYASAIGLSMEDWFSAHVDGNTKILEVADKKVPLEKAEPIIQIFGGEGIGFGSFFPELTEKMYRNTENVDMDLWSEMKAVGFNLSEEPTPISLEEQEKIVLQMVTAYASEYYPELLDPLDLRGHLVV